MSYWYLASPYSKFPTGRYSANFFVCQTAGELMRRGIPIYSPIAHSHAIAHATGMDTLDHDLWMPTDYAMLKAARGLIVLMLPGWQASKGIKAEMGALAVGKRIVFLSFDDYSEPVLKALR